MSACFSDAQLIQPRFNGCWRKGLHTYCRAVYGPPNADTMVAVYTAVEEGQEDFKYYGYFIPESDRFPRVIDTAAYQQKAATALERLRQVQLPEGWQANFPVLATPREYIDSLRISLEALSQGEYPKF